MRSSREEQVDGQRIVDVVAALIWRDGRFLACQRPPTSKRALLWEFPGGKVESGETFPEALRREIREELGANIEVLGKVWQTEHAYPDIHVRLHLFNTQLAAGSEPQLLEHADFRWLMPDGTGSLEFCPADGEILTQLRTGGIRPPRDSDE